MNPLARDSEKKRAAFTPKHKLFAAEQMSSDNQQKTTVEGLSRGPYPKQGHSDFGQNFRLSKDMSNEIREGEVERIMDRSVTLTDIARIEQ